MIKKEILSKLCYTELVYQRINKKLSLRLSKSAIEKLIFSVIEQVPESAFHRRGKNVYISNPKKSMRVTVNSNTFRVITVDRIRENKK